MARRLHWAADVVADVVGVDQEVEATGVPRLQRLRPR